MKNLIATLVLFGSSIAFAGGLTDGGNSSFPVVSCEIKTPNTALADVKVTQNDGIADYQLRVQLKNGEVFALWAAATQLRTSDGRFGGWAVVPSRETARHPLVLDYKIPFHPSEAQLLLRTANGVQAVELSCN